MSPIRPVLAALCLLAAPVAQACTNFLITKGATVDGSTMITYAADAHVLYGELYFTPAAHHPPGAMLPVHEWDTGDYLGDIPQVAQTYTVVGNMNEHQVAIGETTWGGRTELRDPDALIDYGSLMYIALQRAKTAREAIDVMTSLVAEHGYYSSGETFSISDPDEVWLMDLIGKGPDHKGAVWVARKVPDGFVTAHANAPRIRQFPLKDRKGGTLYAPDVISFARDQGYYDGPDAEFSFADAYAPLDYGAVRFCDARVWCMFNRAAPSDPLPSDWVVGKDGAEPLPLWIEPDRKLALADVMSMMRDHFEGTELDMTDDVGAGPYGLPYRWRPLTWESGDGEYLNERATATQQTGFSFVAQSRAWLPDPIGGVLWFSVDDAASTVYFPVYAGVTAVPHSYAVGTGSFHEFSWDSAWWVFNWVANTAYGRYSEMIVDIREVQGELEGGFIAEQAEVDAAALALHDQAPRLARDYLTAYSADAGAEVVRRWRELGEFLLYKYLDGNRKDEHGNVTHPGYPEEWYARVAAATGERLQVKKLPAEVAAEAADEARKAKRADELRAGILAVLSAKGVAADAAQLATDRVDQLEHWLVLATSASSVDDLVVDGVLPEADDGH